MEQKFKSVQLVVSDLDGTLLSTDKSISAQNLAAIDQLRQRGIAFTFASGRMSQMLEAYVNQLAVNIPIIACDGAKVIDLTSNHVLHSQFLDAREAEDLLDFAARSGMDYLAFTMDKVYLTKDSIRTRNFTAYNDIAIQNSTEPLPIYIFNHDHREIAENGILKILIAEKYGTDLDQVRQHIAASRQIYAEMPEDNLIDVLQIGTSKGAAVARLADYLGIRLANVCVIGDYLNDISMLQVAGYSIAMGNAQEEVKKVAMVLTETNDHNGFAKAIEQYVL
jgi:Cof subfamily protein (haloacid dehalogenase superfamily)